jgi:N-terminal domain of anti-restriction factor ArdC
MATNFEMIEELAMMVGYDFDGTNLKTFQEWKKEGMKVKKGETACMKLDLWKPFTVKEKDDEGNVVKDENGKDKVETRFKLVPSCLFSIEQVEKMESKPAKAPKKAKTAKKAKATKAVKKAPEKAVQPVEEVKEVKEEVKQEVKEEVKETPVITEDDVKTAWFSRKPSNTDEVKIREFATNDRYAVVEEVVLTPREMLKFSQDLLMDWEFLKGKGGHDSTNELDVPEGTKWYELTPAQQEYFSKGAYRTCVRVSSPTVTYSLLVDPQGYNYGRYVAIEYK